MQERSLHHIIEALPIKYVEKVKSIDCVPTLIKMKRGASKEKIILLDVRIANLNYLVS